MTRMLIPEEEVISILSELHGFAGRKFTQTFTTVDDKARYSEIDVEQKFTCLTSEKNLKHSEFDRLWNVMNDHTLNISVQTVHSTDTLLITFIRKDTIEVNSNGYQTKS